MLRRGAIVSAFAAGLAMTLAGCGIRGPLYMPKVPPAPTAPTVPDPGLGHPGATTPPAADSSSPVQPARPMSEPSTSTPVPAGNTGGTSAPNAR